MILNDAKIAFKEGSGTNEKPAASKEISVKRIPRLYVILNQACFIDT